VTPNDNHASEVVFVKILNQVCLW